MYEYDNPTIIDANNGKYLAGWDQYGWFSIERVELWSPDEFDSVDGETLIEYDGKEWVVMEPEETDRVNIPPGAIETIITLMRTR